MSSTTFFSFDAPRRDFSRAYAVLAAIAYAALMGAGWWALSRFAPDHVSLRALGRAVTVNNIHQKILGNAALVLLILPTALWLECAVVGWRACSARALLSPSATMKTDLACFILDQLHLMGLMGRIMMLGASVISGVALRDWLARKTGFAIDPVTPAAGGCRWCCISMSIPSSTIGRIAWAIPACSGRCTAITIRPRSSDVINAARIHPAGFAGIFFINIPMPLLGATPEAMIWVNVVTVALGFVIHSRIPSGFGWVGRYLIQSPLHHRLHHKLDMTRGHRLLRHDAGLGSSVRRLERMPRRRCRHRRGHALCPWLSSSCAICCATIATFFSASPASGNFRPANADALQMSFSSQRTDRFCNSRYCGFHMAWMVWPTAVNTTRPLPYS